MKLALLAFDREDVILAALVALMVAGLVVSVGAAVLLRREHRGERRPGESGDGTAS